MRVNPLEARFRPGRTIRTAPAPRRRIQLPAVFKTYLQRFKSSLEPVLFEPERLRKPVFNLFLLWQT